MSFRKLLGGFLVAALVVPAIAQEVEVKNDSVVNGSTAAIQAGFVSGESAAAWLTSPCNGNIIAVSVYWRSVFFNTPPSLEDSITVFAAGTFPNPGQQLLLLEGPVMTDGFLNVFYYTDQGSTNPISIPISASQTFVVSFKFDSTPNVFFGPSVVTDTNGCQAGKNAIRLTNGQWVNSCSFGVSGDFMIRAIVDCQATPPCPGDVDGSGQVNQGDLGILLATFGLCPGDQGYNPAANFAGDACITQADLGVLLGNFGSNCP